MSARNKAQSSISFTHGWDNTKLLQHAKIIHACPKLRNLSVSNAEHLNTLYHNWVSCGRNSHECTFVCAVRCPDLNHLLSLGEQVVGCDVQVREGAK